MKILLKTTIFCLIMCSTFINADNCKNFLTMEGDGQQMSIMLCMKSSGDFSSSNTNLSNVSITDTNNSTNLYFENNNTDLSDDFYSPSSYQNKSYDNISPSPTTTPSPITTPSSTTTPSPITTSSPTTTLSPVTTPSPVTTIPENITATPSAHNNLRGYNNTTSEKQEKYDKSTPDPTLENELITVIVLCICVTLLSVVTLIIVLCKHNKCCLEHKCCEKNKCCQKNKENAKEETDTEAQEGGIKPYGRRVSPTDEKMQHLQYANNYRTRQKLRASSSQAVVERLEKARVDRRKRAGMKNIEPDVPPGMDIKPSSKRPPRERPPRLPPPAPQVAMKEAKKIMDRKNRNSWSVKEIPNIEKKIPTTPESEIATDEISKTMESHDLSKN